MEATIGTTLKNKRNEVGLTVKDVSERLKRQGIKASVSTIYSWENDNSQPSPDAFMLLCDLYKIGDILQTFGFDKEKNTHEKPLSLSASEIELLELYRELPPLWKKAVDGIIEIGIKQRLTERDTQPECTVYSFPYADDLPASAGNGYPALDIAHFEMTELKKAPPKGASFLVRVSGDSMEPEYSDGDRVFIKRQDSVEFGEIGLFFVDGDVYIKKAARGALVPLNPKYRPIVITEDSNVRCFGKVIGKE
jgi:repressor LexA